MIVGDIVVVTVGVGSIADGESDGDAMTAVVAIELLLVVECCDAATADADSMLGLFVDIGTPGSEHGCMPRGLCTRKMTI